MSSSVFGLLKVIVSNFDKTGMGLQEILLFLREENYSLILHSHFYDTKIVTVVPLPGVL